MYVKTKTGIKFPHIFVEKFDFQQNLPKNCIFLSVWSGPVQSSFSPTWRIKTGTPVRLLPGLVTRGGSVILLGLRWRTISWTQVLIAFTSRLEVFLLSCHRFVLSFWDDIVLSMMLLMVTGLCRNSGGSAGKGQQTIQSNHGRNYVAAGWRCFGYMV